MTTKLRQIRTTSRSASVKRSAVSSAARAVIVRRKSGNGQIVDRKTSEKRSRISQHK